jgi:putative flippase GtrA
VLTFAAIGVVSTAAYGVLYLLLRTATGPVPANAVALVATAIGNTAANRRLTFGVRDRASIVRDQAAGLAALGIALAITTASANMLALIAPGAGRVVELAVLVAANALATGARFVLLRAWIAGDRRPASGPANQHLDGSPS